MLLIDTNRILHPINLRSAESILSYCSDPEDLSEKLKLIPLFYILTSERDSAECFPEDSSTNRFPVEKACREGVGIDIPSGAIR